MTFPIDILKKNNILEILNAIHIHNSNILLKIRTSYLYVTQSLRTYQNILNKFYKKKNRLPNISKELREYQRADPKQLENYFVKMEYTLSQFKCLLLFYLVIENIGAPAKILRKIMQELSLFKNKGGRASVVRHAVIDFIYLPPSQAIYFFLNQSSQKSKILKSLLKCPEDSIPDLLKELGINDNIHSLTMGNRKVYDLTLLSEGFTVKEINLLSTNLGIKIEGGMKVEKIQNYIHHTNIGPNDIIENLSNHLLKEKRQYFIRAFNLKNNLKGEEFRQAVITTMKNWGIARSEEFFIEPRFGKFLHIAIDGDICDSDWEVIIDNFLTEKGIPHEKPHFGKYNEYYSNSCMYPDWVIEGKMVELFGAVHQPGYLEKIELKKKTNNLPLVSISKEEFEDDGEKWKDILIKEFIK